MSILSPVTWNQGAVSLVSSTTSQLAAINALQAAFIASTYWEQDTAGTSSLGYKYFVVKPKVSLNSKYSNYRIFFCERINIDTTTRVTPYDAGIMYANGTTAISSYFCPDGGELTFTPANIETSSELWPGTKYRQTVGGVAKTVWNLFTAPWTAFWLYEGDGIVSIITRNSSTSHSVVSLGALMHTPHPSFYDTNSAGEQVTLAGSYATHGLGSYSYSIDGLLSASSNGGQCWWTKSDGVTQRVFRTGTYPQYPSPLASVTNGPTGYDNIDWTSGSNTTLRANGMMTAIPLTTRNLANNNSANGHYVIRGHYFAGIAVTRTTFQTGTPATTFGYAWCPNDTTAIRALFYLNG